MSKNKEMPPFKLYHSTYEEFLPSIMKSGLKSMKRDFVHLSEPANTMLYYGTRKGKPLVIEINARKMYTNGFIFYKSTNDVWLTDHVPTEFITQVKTDDNDTFFLYWN